MKRKIYNRLIGTAALAIVATLLLTVAVCYRIFQEQIMKDLHSCAGVLAEIMAEGAGFTQITSNKQTDEERMRITVIDADGTVVLDTDADVAQMENHSNRPEVQSALDKGEGKIIRKSETLDRSTYYYALRLDSGQILRVAKEADSIYRLMEAALPWLMLLTGLLFLICLIWSHWLAERLVRPVKLIAQDVDNIDKTESYEELSPYIEAIRRKHDDVVQNALMRQEFTANVSHELKTPLAAISGYSELIENKMAASEEEVQRFAGEIHSNANRLLTLINDVIRLSELDADNMEEHLESVDLTEIARTCVNMLQINAEKHHVTLVFEGERATIIATKQMTEEILFNLCDNAIRYNKEGGTVSVLVMKEEDAVVLVVKDTGIGIPKEQQDRVFERFYRVDKGRSKSTGGTGLGLAIVKHILLRLGARLKLESELGVGTTITITF